MISYEELSDVFDMENPLTLEYFEICDKPTSDDGEKHHILPVSMFDKFKNSKWNKVKLSYQNHYRVHEILPFICINELHKHLMAYAWNVLRTTKDGLITSPELFAQLRSLHKKTVAERHRGKIVSEESRRRMTLAQTGRVTSDGTKAILSEIFSGEGNNMYGKTHTDDTKAVLREMKVLDVEPFLEYVRTETPFRMIGEYTAMSEPTYFICDKHGLEFREKPTAVRYRVGIGCKECRNELRYATEYVDSNLPLEAKKKIFRNYLKQNTNLQLVSEFVSMRTPAWFQCNRGHQQFERAPVYVKRTTNPTRCKECNAEDRKAKKLAKEQNAT